MAHNGSRMCDTMVSVILGRPRGRPFLVAVGGLFCTIVSFTLQMDFSPPTEGRGTWSI